MSAVTLDHAHVYEYCHFHIPAVKGVTPDKVVLRVTKSKANPNLRFDILKGVDTRTVDVSYSATPRTRSRPVYEKLLPDDDPVGRGSFGTIRGFSKDSPLKNIVVKVSKVRRNVTFENERDKVANALAQNKILKDFSSSSLYQKMASVGLMPNPFMTEYMPKSSLLLQVMPRLGPVTPSKLRDHARVLLPWRRSLSAYGSYYLKGNMIFDDAKIENFASNDAYGTFTRIDLTAPQRPFSDRGPAALLNTFGLRPFPKRRFGGHGGGVIFPDQAKAHEWLQYSSWVDSVAALLFAMYETVEVIKYHQWFDCPLDNPSSHPSFNGRRLPEVIITHPAGRKLEFASTRSALAALNKSSESKKYAITLGDLDAYADAVGMRIVPVRIMAMLDDGWEIDIPPKWMIQKHADPKHQRWAMQLQTAKLSTLPKQEAQALKAIWDSLVSVMSNNYVVDKSLKAVVPHVRERHTRGDWEACYDGIMARVRQSTPGATLLTLRAMDVLARKCDPPLSRMDWDWAEVDGKMDTVEMGGWIGYLVYVHEFLINPQVTQAGSGVWKDRPSFNYQNRYNSKVTRVQPYDAYIDTISDSYVDPRAQKEHDYPRDAKGVPIPYGYDLPGLDKDNAIRFLMALGCLQDEAFFGRWNAHTNDFLHCSDPTDAGNLRVDVAPLPRFSADVKLPPYGPTIEERLCQPAQLESVKQRMFALTAAIGK